MMSECHLEWLIKMTGPPAAAEQRVSNEGISKSTNCFPTFGYFWSLYGLLASGKDCES